jgi:protein-L-isoaspartate O-methyltransferase
MLDMLRLQPGQTVFELGAGSGWNAALMGHLVCPDFKLQVHPSDCRMAAHGNQWIVKRSQSQFLWSLEA